MEMQASLVASGWDLDKAYDVLRQKGLAAAAKKASRHASQGLVGLAASAAGASAPVVAVVEINSETDFVARGDLFRGLVSQAAAAALAQAQAQAGPAPQQHQQQLDEAQLSALLLPGGSTVGAACAEVAATVRENIKPRRAFLLRGPPGSVAGTYLHMSPAPGLGSIAAAVLLQPEQPGAALPASGVAEAAELAQGVAMHAAGMRPLYLDRADVPAEALQRERQVLSAQASGSGKPEAVVAKMVEGRLSKYYEDVCLLEQKYLLDDAVKVRAAVSKLSKQLASPLRVAAFLRVQCGEGLDTVDKADFATEVASLANS